MPLVKSEYACPLCAMEGKTSQIVANMGELLCSVNGTHKWNDAAAFSALNPQMKFKVEMPKSLPQQNYEPFNLSVPLGLKGALETKYGDKAAATAASILMQMIEGNIMIVGQTDLERLTTHLGKTPDNSGELVGMVYAKAQEAEEAKQIAEAAGKDLKAYEGLSVGRVVVDLGDQYQNALDKARGEDLPLKIWVERALKNGLENSWF